MTNLYALLKIELAFMKRNKISWILGVGMPVMFFILFSSIFKFDSAQQQADAIRQMMISMTVFSSISFAVFTFPFSLLKDKQSHWVQYLKYSPISAWQYYLARGISLIINFTLAIFTVLFIAIAVKGVHLTIYEIFMIWLLVVLGSCCTLAMASLLTLIKSGETLSLTSNIVYMALGVLGGLWFPIATFPQWLQNISHWVPTYHLAKIGREFLMSHHINFTSASILLIYALSSMMIVYSIKKLGV